MLSLFPTFAYFISRRLFKRENLVDLLEIVSAVSSAVIARVSFGYISFYKHHKKVYVDLIKIDQYFLEKKNIF